MTKESPSKLVLKSQQDDDEDYKPQEFLKNVLKSFENFEKVQNNEFEGIGGPAKMRLAQTRVQIVLNLRKIIRDFQQKEKTS